MKTIQFILKQATAICLLLLSFLLSLSTLMYGQTPSTPPVVGIGWSYDSLFRYQQNLTNLSDSTESGDKSKFDRWDHFWRPRASNIPLAGIHPMDPTNEGVMNFMKRYLLNQDWCLNTARGSFEQFGPSAPTDLTTNRNAVGQMIGRVQSVWLDPDNVNHALVGSYAGGLYETTNLQNTIPSWTNITDNSNSIIPGTMGITSIAMPPRPSELIGNATPGPFPIYLSTGIGNHYDHFYGVGLVFSNSLTTPVWQQEPSFHSANQVAHSRNPLSLTENFTQLVRYAPQTSPTADVICYAASGGHLFKQVNKGSWAEITGTAGLFPAGDITDIAFDPVDRNHILLSSYRGNGSLTNPRFGQLWERNPTSGFWSDITASIPLANAYNFMHPSATNTAAVFDFLTGSIRTGNYFSWSKINVNQYHHLPAVRPIPLAIPIPPNPWVTDPVSGDLLHNSGATREIGINLRGVLHPFLQYRLEIDYDCPPTSFLSIAFGLYNWDNSSVPGQHTYDIVNLTANNTFNLNSWTSPPAYSQTIILDQFCDAYKFTATGPGIRIRNIKLTQIDPLSMHIVEMPNPNEFWLGVNMQDGFSYIYQSTNSPINWVEQHHDELGQIDGYAISSEDRDRQYVINAPHSAYTEDNWATVITGTTPGSMFHGDGAAGQNHVDTRCIVLGPRSTADGDEVFVGNDGGPSYRPGGFLPPNLDQLKVKNGPGLAISTFYGISDPDLGNGVVVGGLQDEGAYDYSPSRTIPWRNDAVMGDGYDSYFDKDRMNEVMNTGFNNSLFEADLNSAGTSIYNQRPNPNEFCYKTKPFRSDGDLNTYVGYSRIWLEDPTNVDWWVEPYAPVPNDVQPFIFSGTHLISPGEAKAVRAFEINPQNKDEWYVAYDGGGDIEYFYKRIWNPLPLPGKWEFVDRTPAATSGAIAPNEVYTINDIAVDPVDFDRLWVCFGQTSGNTTSTPGVFTTTAGVNRVWHSTDGGVTWMDASSGLPEVPVNCLEYQKGSNDIIYAGTDVGVYVFDKTQGGWQPYNKLKNDEPDIVECYSPMIVMDIELNYCLDEMYVATWGRGIWKSPLVHNSIVLPAQIISSNTTWTSDKFIEGSLIIKSGNTLTINGTPTGIIGDPWSTHVYMGKDARIEVEKNASIVINQATLTNGCNQRWGGIFLHGDGVSAQNKVGNLYPNQGYLNATSARFENAHTAIHNYGGDDPWPNTGGVLIVHGSEFVNNRRGVEFLAYSPHWPAQQDYSRISLTNFDVNNDKDFWAHITMWGVKGINIKACNFKNSQNLDYSHLRAILSIDASYFLSGGGGTNALFGRVEGFHEGVRSTGYDLFKVNLISPVSINGTLFDNNEIGVYFDEVRFAQIIGNRFNIGAKQTPGVQTAFDYSLGSKLVDVTEFMYHSNFHHKLYGLPHNAGGPYTAGTEVYNTGVNNQPITNNVYEDLLIGNDAAFTCGGINGTGISVGLNYSCNTNINNTGWDFIIRESTQVRDPQSLNFGPSGSTAATGNILTDQTITPSNIHWYHDNPTIPVTYFYSNLSNEEPLNDLATVNKLPASTDGTCGSTSNDVVEDIFETEGGYGLANFQNLKYKYDTTEANYNSALATLQLLIDDGDTPQTEDDIENSNSSQQMQIRAEMLSRSPYVSQDVLRTLAIENILSQSIFLEILLANPDATKDEDFLEFLQYEAPNPLPAYMINLIRSSWTGVSVRKLLESDISYFLFNMTQMKNDIVLIYFNDSLLHDEDSALVWMQKIPSIKGQYLLMEYWISKKDFDQAELILNGMTTNWEMNEQEYKDYYSYVQVFNFKKQLAFDSLDINQLDSNRIAQLQVIADNSEFSTGRQMARNALCFFYQICYPGIQNSILQLSFKKIPIIKLEKESNLKVFPNPAKDHVTFQILNSTHRCTDCRIIITDLQGRKVYEDKLNDLSNMHIWDTRNISPGTYLYQVKTNTSVESGKVIIVK